MHDIQKPVPCDEHMEHPHCCPGWFRVSADDPGRARPHILFFVLFNLGLQLYRRHLLPELFEDASKKSTRILARRLQEFELAALNPTTPNLQKYRGLMELLPFVLCWGEGRGGGGAGGLEVRVSSSLYVG